MILLHIPRPDRLVQTVKTRLEPPEIQSSAVGDLLARYGLEQAGSSQNLTVRKRNRNLVVKTSAGKKVLKQYWHGWPSSFIVHEHSILAHLAAHHFQAPRPIATLAGDTFVGHQDHHYALFEFEAGKNYASSFLLRPHRLRLMTLAGRTMAGLHRQLAGFMPQGRHYTGFRPDMEDRWRDMNWHVNKVAELEKKTGRLVEAEKIECASWLMAHSHYILDEMRRLDEILRTATLPRLLIHGDYGLHNLHFHRNGTVTVLDFESCRLEWRLRDLITCLSRFRYTNGAFDLQSVRRFVTAYEAVFPLSSDEWRLLPQVWRFCKLQDAVKYWNSFFETNGPYRKLASAQEAVEQADWALSHATEVIMPS